MRESRRCPGDSARGGRTARLQVCVGDATRPAGASAPLRARRETGRRLVRHPVPAMVSVTGSFREGTEVAGASAADVKRLHLELGSKALDVVAADADLDQAAFFNSARDCASARRVMEDRLCTTSS
ncbi:aldehyde dehydrogenase family protein [Streptomyces sp. NPDC059215]|uniref:aldehyde dehydrogenase family protein n=1 Tax=Streptomyces sp. NPDC059215 TaxID=3346772 RepID=UPI0036C143F7